MVYTATYAMSRGHYAKQWRLTKKPPLSRHVLLVGIAKSVVMTLQAWFGFGLGQVNMIVIRVKTRELCQEILTRVVMG
jgi:hypothetical protein